MEIEKSAKIATTELILGYISESYVGVDLPNL